VWPKGLHELYLDAGYREVGRSADGLVYYEKQIGNRL
jgi:hypothetical protein